jgi:hypothetical protein
MDSGAPLPIQFSPVLASGGVKLWLAGQVGPHCSGGRWGETVGTLSAAVMLSRSALAAQK